MAQSIFTRKRLQLAAAAAFVGVGVGLSALFAKRVFSTPASSSPRGKKRKQKKKSKKNKTLTIDSTSISKKKLIEIITRITVVLQSMLQQLLQIQKELNKQNAPEEQKRAVLREQFNSALTQAGQHVYGIFKVTEKDVEAAHKKYKADKAVVEASSKIKKIQEMLLAPPAPIPSHIGVKDAKQIMADFIRGTTKKLADAIDKAKVDLDIKSNEELKSIIKSDGHPKKKGLQQVLRVANDPEVVMKEVLAKRGDIGNDTRIFQSISMKFGENMDFAAHLQQLSAEQQRTLASRGLA